MASTRKKTSKTALSSKTIWANLIVSLLVALVPKAREIVLANPDLSVTLIAAVNVVLRLLTKTAIRLRRKPKAHA